MKTLSLFAGAGGLDIGISKRFAVCPIAIVEKNPQFCETLRRNVGAGRLDGEPKCVLEMDLGTTDFVGLRTALGVEPGEVDLLIGGPPCQSFSTAGRRGTIQDVRGELLWAFVRAVEAFRPRWFLMENVRGLLSAAIKHRPIASRPAAGGRPLSPEEEPGSVIALWASDLERVGGYRVDCFEVNAVNYGAPQLRERVLFFGNSDNKVVDFLEPTHGPKLGQEPYATLEEGLRGLSDPDPELLDFSSRKKGYLRNVPPGGNWRALPEDLQKESMGRAYFAKGGRSGWWRRLSWDLPAPTIMTMPNHASSSLCHPDEVRVLSLKECARLQGFPDDWEFAGTIQERYEQVGNAVPVRLAEVAADAIQAADRAEPGIAQFRRVYLDSHVRTRRWYKSGRVLLMQGGKEVDLVSS